MILVSLSFTFPAPAFGVSDGKALLYFRVETEDGWGRTQNLIGKTDTLIIAASMLIQGNSGIDEAFKFIEQGKQAGEIVK